MPKKPRVRTLMDSEDVKGSGTLHKSAQQYFCLIFWEVWKKIGSKKPVLVVYEILRLCVNILTPNERRSLSVKVTVYSKQFEWNYLQIKKYFLIFFLHFRNLHKILNTFKEKMILRGYSFLKL